jgi:DNA replication protein DnaC
MTENQNIAKMNQMKLYGMARAYEMLHTTHHSSEMNIEDTVTHLVETEWDDRQNQKLKRLLKTAKFRYQACMQEINYTQERNLDKNLILKLAGCNYLEKKENIIITGATGVGKSHLATALGNEACISGYKTTYFNVNKLLTYLKMKRADGSYLREIERLERQDLLILDDFGLAQLDTQNRLDLLEILDDRHGKKSTIITSQLPVTKWHDVIADQTIADAILDRLVHNAHRIELKGPSLRK